jgi:DNA polymerase III epsilon subunit-like protein
MTSTENRNAPIYVSVDIEAAGPYPPKFSMIQFGACDVYHPERQFKRDLKPINNNFRDSAMAVSGLSFEGLKTTGTDPKIAMAEFAEWLVSLGPPEKKRVMIGQAAPFDWQFINYYFEEFFGSNPLGFTAIDNKALFMGATGCDWKDTGAKAMDAVLGTEFAKTHDGLDDAVYQAELFRRIMDLASKNAGKGTE